jgi:hypothetical protein
MVVVPLSTATNEMETTARPFDFTGPDWLRYVAAGTLAAGGVMLVTGQRKAGLVAAASGAAMAMLDQKEVIQEWWEALPGLLGEAQGWLNRAQSALDEVSAQRQKVHQVLGR